MKITTRATMFGGLLLLLSTRADAATIIFDFCTEPSFCGRAQFSTQLQPDGSITTHLGGTNQDGRFLKMNQFGINFPSDAIVTFTHGPLAPPDIPLGTGDIGPYGPFTQRWISGDANLRFRDPDGPFPNDLAAFFENANGMFMAAEISDVRTGATSFVAARLVDSTPVPEPATMLLLGSGLVAIARRVRRRPIQPRSTRVSRKSATH